MYGTVDLADDYFETRVQNDAWVNATVAQKTAALTTASSDLNNLNYTSDKVDDTQTDEWPRKYINSSVTPPNILLAAYEQAKAYLDGKEQDAEAESALLQSQTFGPVRTTYDRRTSIPVHIQNGILSIVSWRYLKPYLRHASHVELVRG